MLSLVKCMKNYQEIVQIEFNTHGDDIMLIHTVMTSC